MNRDELRQQLLDLMGKIREKDLAFNIKHILYGCLLMCEAMKDTEGIKKNYREELERLAKYSREDFLDFRKDYLEEVKDLSKPDVLCDLLLGMTMTLAETGKMLTANGAEFSAVEAVSIPNPDSVEN